MLQRLGDGVSKFMPPELASSGTQACECAYEHAGLVMRSPGANVEAHVRRELLTQEPHLLPLLFMHARNAWLSPGHPGWGVFKFQGVLCADIPHVFSESEPSHHRTPFSYACESSLIPCYTPPASAEQAVHEPIHEAAPPAGQGGDALEAGIFSSEIKAPGVSGDIFSMSSPEKAPESRDLFHLSADPLAPAAAPNPDGDVDMHAPRAFAGVDGASTGAAADVGASVFDSISFKGLSTVTNLSSLFASAVSLPADENANASTPPVINWMATTSNAKKMGVNVSVSPANVFPLGAQAGNETAAADEHQENANGESSI